MQYASHRLRRSLADGHTTLHCAHIYNPARSSISLSVRAVDRMKDAGHVLVRTDWTWVTLTDESHERMARLYFTASEMVLYS